MLRVSKEYKEIMSRRMRNKGHISVGLGIVNQEAQADGKFVGNNYTYWSDLSLPFTNKAVSKEYATMEQNLFKLDGSMLFLPEKTTNMQLSTYTGVITSELLGAVTIAFPTKHDIKGLTINFGDYYPTRFRILTDSNSFTCNNDSPNFVFEENLGNTDSISIVPISMIGGQQRFRINNIVMGVGLQFTDSDVQSSALETFVHSIAEELPYINFSLSIADVNNVFNINNENSYINFLKQTQKVNVSVGLEMDDESIEWLNIANLLLYKWDDKKGQMNFMAKDRISFLTDIYSAGNRIHTRTLYDDAVAVLKYEDLEPDEYELDECLKDVTITNPLPEGECRYLLQLIANAGRCILMQNVNGKVCIRANFANVLEPSDVTVSATGASEWSNISNIKKGSDYVYADMTRDFFCLDGTMYFMPEDGSYLGTSFASALVADGNGSFSSNPTITLELSAGYIYYGIYINFDGNPPQEMKVYTYYNSAQQEVITFNDLEKNNILNHEFDIFDKMVFEFTKAAPNDRVLVNSISFGDLSDYTLRRQDMMSEPVGVGESKKKDVRVKIFTFVNNDNNIPEQVADSVYYDQVINTEGSTVTFENQLISTESHARTVAEWIGNYYANNVAYGVEYRGEPRLSAPDIFFMELENATDLQVECTTSKLTYNGAFGGSLEMRKALRMINN